MLFPVQLWGYLPFLFAVCCAFAGKKMLTLLGLLVGFVICHDLQLIEPLTIFAILVSFILAAVVGTHPYLKRQTSIRYLSYFLLILWSVALFTHKVPGFNNFELLHQVKASEHSQLFSLWLNLDKFMVFFTLWLAQPHLFGRKKHSSMAAVVILCVLCFSLLLIAATLGAIKFEPSWPNWLIFFAINNLLIVCVCEEAFFRGFIQQGLSKKMPWLLALLIAAVFFGLSHWQGGYLLIIFATIAGIFYGLMFRITGRLWAAILLHFGLNMAHILLFTYPVLAK
jgi:membrane protease YdiL (CAAX protease family)